MPAPTVTEPGHLLEVIPDQISGLDSVYATKPGGVVIAGIVGVNLPDQNTGAMTPTWYLIVCGQHLPPHPGFTSYSDALAWLTYLVDLIVSTGNPAVTA